MTYKVTLESYSVELYLFDIPINLQNKSMIIALALLETPYDEHMRQVVRTTLGELPTSMTDGKN